MRGAEATREALDRLGPGESIPIERRRLTERNGCRLVPRPALERVARLCRREMKRRLEARFDALGVLKAFQLRRGPIVGTLLEVRIDEILDGVRKLVPYVLTGIARRRRERRLRSALVPTNHPIPIADRKSTR